MFRLICKKLLHSKNGYSCHYNPSSMVVSLSLIRYFSSNADNPHSFTLSYLTQTCGLSPKSALSASKIVRFESPEKPDSVLFCLQKYGFSKSHISEMITKYPKVLCCKPEKTISPKLDFFRSKGVSTSEIITIFTLNPSLFVRSLENTLVRNSNILIEIFQSEDKAIQVIKQNPYVLLNSPEVSLKPNVTALRENGVPDSNILRLIHKQWLCIGTNPIKFKKVLEELNEMGFDPLKSQFIIAIWLLAVLPKSKWDGRIEVFKRYGWSDKNIIAAFKKDPLCMAITKENIVAKMDFYVNKLGVKSSIFVNFPLLLRYSLKKRLIPRGAVIEYLSSKGLVKLDSNVTTMFMCPEMRFLEKYVKCHDEAPHLMNLYNGKLNEAIGEGKGSHEDIEIGES